MRDVFGDFELSMECVFSWKEYMFCGSYEVFGTKEMLGSSDDCTGSPQR